MARITAFDDKTLVAYVRTHKRLEVKNKRTNKIIINLEIRGRYNAELG